MSLTPSDYNKAKPFKAFIQQVLPTVYDDSLSYSELLYKVLYNMDLIVENNNLLIDDIQKLYEYTNNYFENLDVQTEIDNKLEQMYNSGQLDELFKKYLDPKIEEQGEEINVLKSRMDEFTKLEEGSTTGDAELQDGRIDFTGHTWPNIGDAIRGITEEVFDYTEKTRAEKVFIPTDNKAEVTVLGNVVTKNMNFNDSTGTSVSFPVSTGDVYFITGKTYTNAYPAYMFFNDDTFVSEVTPIIEYKDYIKEKVMIPCGVNKLIINGGKSNEYNYPTVYYSQSIDLPEINDDVENNTRLIKNSDKGTLINNMADIIIPKNGLYFKDSKEFSESDHYKTFEFDVNPFDIVQCIGGSSGNGGLYDIFRFLDNEGNIILYYRNENGTVDFNKTFVAPVNVKSCVVTFRATSYTMDILLRRESLNYGINGKKIVWFGTSIPEGKYNRGGKNISYPEIIGEKLGITVYNESVGESKVHGPRYSGAVTENNPYGISASDYISTVKVFTNDLNVQQWLIDNWQNPMFTTGTPENMDEEEQAKIKGYSYQERLDKYLNKENFPDLFVFDFGRNDMWQASDWTLNEEEPYSLVNGSFQSGMNFLIKHILEYNPKAKIVLIGHYTNQVRNPLDNNGDHPDKIAFGQEQVSEYWELPLFKLWEVTGWSNKTITYNGVQQSVLATWLPDKLHPHSDTSGKAINHIADLLLPFIKNNLI